jgi:hypothetical protein
MTKTEALKRIENGEFLGGIAEYRSSSAETIKYQDKKTGRMAEMSMLRHNIEVGDVAVALNERTSDGFNASAYKSPFKKGQRVVVRLQGMEIDKGLVRARGTLEAIES